MTDKREVFTVLEDSTGEGKSWVKKLETDTHATVNLAPVVAGKKGANFSLIPINAASDAVGDGLPSLAAKDLAGLLQYINQRLEGAAISGVGALPGLVAKDLTGNFAYLKVNANGELVVSDPSGFVPIFGEATVTPSAINTKTEVVNLTLTASEVYEQVKVNAASTFTTRWEIEAIADAEGTPIVTKVGSFITGPGQFSFQFNPDLWKLTAGATGVQSLVLYGTQLQGAVSDMHGYLEVAELA